MRFKIIKEVSISFIKHHRGYAFFFPILGQAITMRMLSR